MGAVKFLLGFVPCRRIPNFGVTAHANYCDILCEASVGAKGRRQKDAALFVRLYLAGIGIQKALYLPRLEHALFLQKCVHALPLFLRKGHKAVIQPFGYNKRLAHLFSEFGREIQAAFAVYCIVVLAQQHTGHHLSD